MTVFKKHEHPLDVQLRTKIFDQNGAELSGVIEYDVNSGYGKRVKLGSDPKHGLIEEFYCGNGILELDGNTFDNSEGHGYDEDKIDAIIQMVLSNVSRNANPRAYEELLEHLTNMNRRRARPPVPPSPPGPPSPPAQASGLYEIEAEERKKRDAKYAPPKEHPKK